MEYVKGKPYFCYGNKKIKQYPYLKNNIECEILIVGGGIDGAIANFYLSKNHDVVLVDKSRFGYSCTACATALLEYQLDELAKDLKPYLTNNQIVSAYKMGLNSINKIKNFVGIYGNECNFALRPTFLYSDSNSFVKDLKQEYYFRKENGFNCELITQKNNPFPFEVKAGIYCADGGCEIDPYLFTKQMIENSKNQDKIFENTHITNLVKQDYGYLAITNFGEKIKCKKVLIATGFNWELLHTKNICVRYISYTIVTEQIKGFSWHNKALIHDVNSPYHYLRLLPDNRIIFGGEDTKYKEKPIDEKLANKKYDKLEKDLKKLFPNLTDKIKVEFKFCGCFGTTDDNLGIIGKSGIDEDLLLFISCGANGIINAMIGVELIEDILKNKNNELSVLFSPNRM